MKKTTPAERRMRVQRRILAVLLAMLLALSVGNVLYHFAAEREAPEALRAMGFLCTATQSPILGACLIVWVGAGLVWSIRTLWKEEGMGKIHWGLLLFLAVDCGAHSAIGLWDADWRLALPLRIAQILTFSISIPALSAKFARRKSKKAGEADQSAQAEGQTAQNESDVQTTEPALADKVFERMERLIQALVVVLLCCSWNAIFQIVIPDFSGIPWLRGIGFFMMEAAPTVGAWMNSDIAAILMGAALTVVLLWSVNRIGTHRREGGQHWLLGMYLFMEGLIHLYLWATNDQQVWLQENVIPSALLIGAAAVLTLVMNVGRMLAQRLKKPRIRIGTDEVMYVGGGSVALTIGCIILADIAPLIMHIVELYLNFELDYTQTHILNMLNTTGVFIVFLTFLIFGCGILLRRHIYKNAPEWRGRVSMITAPTFVVSVLVLLYCCAAVVYMLGDDMDTGKQASYSRNGYTYVIQPDGTAHLTDYSGSEERVVVPDELDGHAVTSIGSKAFRDREKMVEIVLPDSVTKVWDNPFVMCSALTTITVSEEHPVLEVVDGVLFDRQEKRLICMPYALGRTSYEIPEGTREVGAWAFYWCRELEEISFPDSLTSIGEYAFYNCEGLTKVQLPDGITYIGNGAFFSADAIVEINVPRGLEQIGEGAFCEMYALTHVTIPDGITVIGRRAFAVCGNLTYVEIPPSLTDIENEAFTDCRNLTTLYIPDSVTYISSGAFDNCTSLTLIVEEGSYAEEYAQKYRKKYSVKETAH